MTKEEIKKEIEKAQLALRGAEREGIVKFVTKAKDKIAMLFDKLAELEESEKAATKAEVAEPKKEKEPEKPKAKAKRTKSKAKPVKKEVAPKKEKEPEKEAGTTEVEGKKWKYNSKVIEHSKDHFIVLYNSDTKDDAEVKFVDGQWELICKQVKNYPKFKRADIIEAIDFVLEIKHFIATKPDRVKKAKERKAQAAKERNKSESTKTADVVEKAAETVEEKVKELTKEGEKITASKAESISVDVEKIVDAIRKGIKEAERKQFINNLISKLKKLL